MKTIEREIETLYNNIPVYAMMNLDFNYSFEFISVEQFIKLIEIIQEYYPYLVPDKVEMNFMVFITTLHKKKFTLQFENSFGQPTLILRFGNVFWKEHKYRILY